MAHAELSGRNPPVGLTFGTSMRRLLDRLAAIDAELRLRAELERLDEDTLRDVGLTRARIDAELRRRRWARPCLTRASVVEHEHELGGVAVGGGAGAVGEAGDEQRRDPLDLGVEA